ncbi:MAG: COQ9 family protein [Rhodospirillales bacterium]
MSDLQVFQRDLGERRDALLDAMLDDVPFDGWTEMALKRATGRLGLTYQEAELAYPRGLREIARNWSDRSDTEMLRRLDQKNLESMRIRDRIAAAVRVRIEVNFHRREALRRLIGWLAVPTNAPTAASNAARTVNHMWYAAGDISADWNYYTKRGLLLPVYTSTVLYWLADQADEDGDYPATWSYLDRRIDDVLKTFSTPRRIKSRIEGFLSGTVAQRRQHRRNT